MIKIKFKDFIAIAHENVDKSRLTMRVYRFISKYISYVFVHLRITPNQVTVAHSILEFFGLLILSTGNYDRYYIAFILLVLGGILDNVDGEIARYTKIFSIPGYYLDFIFHRIIHPFFFLLLSIGIYKNTSSLLIIYLGMISGVAYTISEISTNVYKHLLFDKGIKIDEKNNDNKKSIINWWNYTFFCFDHMKIGLLVFTFIGQLEYLIYLYTPLLFLRAVFSVIINYNRLKNIV
jgi:phosphatidylglycerophosphate synthase